MDLVPFGNSKWYKKFVETRKHDEIEVKDHPHLNVYPP